MAINNTNPDVCITFHICLSCHQVSTISEIFRIEIDINKICYINNRGSCHIAKCGWPLWKYYVQILFCFNDSQSRPLVVPRQGSLSFTNTIPSAVFDMTNQNPFVIPHNTSHSIIRVTKLYRAHLLEAKSNVHFISQLSPYCR